MDETWKFLIIISVNILALVITIWKFQASNDKKQAYWTGKVEQKLDDLCNRVTRLENRIFNGGGKV